VSNRPIIQDPMMVDESTKSVDPAAEPAKPIRTPGGIKIQPLTAPPLPGKEDVAQKEEPGEPDEPIAKPSPDEAVPTVPDEPAPEPEVEPAPESEPKKTELVEEAAIITETETASDTTNDGDKTSPTDPAAEIEAAELKHQESIQKLVESKQYFLPINSVEQRRSKRFVALGILFSLVLAVAWVDVALDAGLVKIGNVKPVTHFFSN
jgi:hypothetical protein